MKFASREIKNLGCNKHAKAKEIPCSKEGEEVGLENGKEGGRSLSQRAISKLFLSTLVTGFRGLRATFTRGERVVG